MADGADTGDGAGPVGLDDRPRPASARERILQGLKRSAPFSSLQRRIIFLNLVALALLVGGILYLNQFRSSLIAQRVEALETQGEIIALTIAETAAVGDAPGAGYDPVKANVVLTRLARPTGLRARIYDARLRLTGDTRAFPPGAGTEDAPRAAPSGEATGWLAGVQGVVEEIAALLGAERAPAREEAATAAGISREVEVRQAARGQPAHSVTLNAREELIVSVAVPLRRSGETMGVLVLSTKGGEIDEIVRGERGVILFAFVFAAIVSVGLSVLLANTIAAPIRRLAAAAESGGARAGRALTPGRVEIPDMTRRADEIGELSAALIHMTEALYKRIEAIESFASDVAHEIKNPLTSLRSAVETMHYARTPEQRQRLLDVIQADVGRMDRLVTDISNASRLDAELVRDRRAPFDLAALAGMLADVTGSQGEGRGVRVETRLPEDGLVVEGLEGRLAQVITNLLDNALSFSPDGGRIRLELARTEGAARLTVSDEGPGIPAENMESIFQRFYTERPGAESFGAHSGLGLSISRQIVEAHGGRIRAENIPGAAPGDGPAGARFVVELPA